MEQPSNTLLINSNQLWFLLSLSPWSNTDEANVYHAVHRTCSLYIENRELLSVHTVHCTRSTNVKLDHDFSIASSRYQFPMHKYDNTDMCVCSMQYATQPRLQLKKGKKCFVRSMCATSKVKRNFIYLREIDAAIVRLPPHHNWCVRWTASHSPFPYTDSD